jgi:hypothetical protein
MRKLFLVALMAGAMFAVAAPAASVAAHLPSCHKHHTDSPECVCPPGTDNPAYCVRATPRETADACAVAGVAAANTITDSSTSITFSFKAGVTGECHFTLLFADPGSGKNGHPIKYVIVGQAVINTTAGQTSTVTVALNAVGLADIAHDAPGDLTQLFEVVTKQITSKGSAVVHVFGSFTLP